MANHLQGTQIWHNLALLEERLYIIYDTWDMMDWEGCFVVCHCLVFYSCPPSFDNASANRSFLVAGERPWLRQMLNVLQSSSFDSVTFCDNLEQNTNKFSLPGTCFAFHRDSPLCGITVTTTLGQSPCFGHPVFYGMYRTLLRPSKSNMSSWPKLWKSAVSRLYWRLTSETDMLQCL